MTEETSIGGYKRDCALYWNRVAAPASRSATRNSAAGEKKTKRCRGASVPSLEPVVPSRVVVTHQRMIADAVGLHGQGRRVGRKLGQLGGGPAIQEAALSPPPPR